MDALMPVSTEWLQWWPGGQLVRHKDDRRLVWSSWIEREESVSEMWEEWVMMSISHVGTRTPLRKLVC
jgi:hypothetical protein